MKKLITFYFIATIISPIHVAWSATPGNEYNVMGVSVVEQYFDALAQGNAQVIKTLLGGNLLKQQEAMLSNPNYGTHLRKIYANAKFEITNQETIDSDKLAIDTRIILNTQDQMNIRFILGKSDNKNYKIMAEKEI